VRDRGATEAPGPAFVSPARTTPPSALQGRATAPGLIPIAPGPLPQAVRANGKHPNPETFWDQYYKTHDDKPADLLETVSYLGRAQEFVQVEAALLGYLRHHSKKAEPWMYDTLAVAYEKNERGTDRIKTALGYAAYLARQSRNPADLTIVADMLFLRGYLDNYDVTVAGRKEQVGVASLLDVAADLGPHLPAPLMMSMNLAQKTKDPTRMVESLERLLALGWPGFDDTIRRQARNAVETMAKSLREDDRSAEAETLLSRLAESEGRDLFIRLTWDGDADLDLNVQEPLGATANHNLKRTVFGGAIVKEGLGKRAEEVYVCPRAFDGVYTVSVDTIFNNDKNPATVATLDIITHEGMAGEHKETRKIELSKPGTVAIGLSEGRRKKVLPFIAPTVVLPPGSAKTRAETSRAPSGPASTPSDPASLLKPSSPSPGTRGNPPAGSNGSSEGRTKPAAIVVPSRRPSAPAPESSDTSAGQPPAR